MACFETGTVVSLANREAVALPNVRGATLRVAQGTVWLTEERQPHDVVLRPGDNWVVEHDGKTVVEAQNDAVFCIVGRHGVPLKFRTTPHPDSTGILATLASFFTAPPRHLPYV
jgi:hypothetical protein